MSRKQRNFFDNRELFYFEPNFWSAEECWQLREISRFGATESAGVYSNGDIKLDPDYRRTSRIVLNEGIHAEIERSIWTAKDRLQEHFGLQLKSLAGSQLLRYSAGDYFRLHQDEGRVPSSGTRKLAIVIFLNSRMPAGQRSNPNDSQWFKGGDLIFHEQDKQQGKGHVFTAEEGLLLAFSPYLFHQVQEVTHGIRYTVVTWFL